MISNFYTLTFLTLEHRTTFVNTEEVKCGPKILYQAKLPFRCKGIKHTHTTLPCHILPYPTLHTENVQNEKEPKDYFSLKSLLVKHQRTTFSFKKGHLKKLQHEDNYEVPRTCNCRFKTENYAGMMYLEQSIKAACCVI